MRKQMKLKDLIQEGRFIQEKFNKKINEAPFGNEPVGEIPHQYTDIKELVKDYVRTRFSADQGSYDVEEELKTLEQEIIKMRGKSYFELAEVLSSLHIYAHEYAGPEESKKVNKSIIRICKQLGLPSGDYVG